MDKTAVILVNVGTPEEPSVKKIKSFLREFLNDPLVIDIPWLLRKILVNGFIIPVRAKKSTALYQKLWLPKGSPLIIHGENSRRKLQISAGAGYDVFFTTRYGKTGLKQFLSSIRDRYQKIILFPLFPQPARSTTTTVTKMFHSCINDWETTPSVKIVPPFYREPGYIESLAVLGRQHRPENFDKILFSFHGLPLRQVHEKTKKTCCKNDACEKEFDPAWKSCYKASCYETARLLANKLNIPPAKYTVCFQSRMHGKWLSPFTDNVIRSLGKKKLENILVFSPSFVADCLETTVEIGIGYRELFKKHGGKKLQLVEGLNDHPVWIKTMKSLIQKMNETVIDLS